jgi:hypothetical protein
MAVEEEVATVADFSTKRIWYKINLSNCHQAYSYHVNWNYCLYCFHSFINPFTSLIASIEEEDDVVR